VLKTLQRKKKKNNTLKINSTKIKFNTWKILQEPLARSVGKLTCKRGLQGQIEQIILKEGQ